MGSRKIQALAPRGNLPGLQLALCVSLPVTLVTRRCVVQRFAARALAVRSASRGAVLARAHRATKRQQHQASHVLTPIARPLSSTHSHPPPLSHAHFSFKMSADLAARIEYSEKYNDDRFEYRCVVLFYGTTLKSHVFLSLSLSQHAPPPASRLSPHNRSSPLQARDSAEGSGEQHSEEEAAQRAGVAWDWRAAEPRMGALRDPPVSERTRADAFTVCEKERERERIWRVHRSRRPSPLSYSLSLVPHPHSIFLSSLRPADRSRTSCSSDARSARTRAAARSIPTWRARRRSAISRSTVSRKTQPRIRNSRQA